jgi:hypothetical protein
MTNKKLTNLKICCFAIIGQPPIGCNFIMVRHGRKKNRHNRKIDDGPLFTLGDMTLKFHDGRRIVLQGHPAPGTLSRALDKALFGGAWAESKFNPHCDEKTGETDLQQSLLPIKQKVRARVES